MFTLICSMRCIFKRKGQTSNELRFTLVCQSGTINWHLLQTQTSFRCKASLEISGVQAFLLPLWGSHCLEMDQKQMCVSILLFLYFPSVKAESVEKKKLWKEKNQNYWYCLMQKLLSHWYFTPSFIFLRVYTWAYAQSCVYLIPAAMFSLVRLLGPFSTPETLHSPALWSQVGPGKPPAALQRKQHCPEARLAQPWCRR